MRWNVFLSLITRFSAWPIVAAFCLVLGLGVSAPSEALLTYHLPSDLKKSGCSGDTDNDCLDNNEEGNLASVLAPMQYYDEDEDCSGWTNKWSLPSSHFYRRDYFQVRPSGSGVGDWSATDGKAKWVQVTYFLLYPHDCQSYLGFGGHQGDSEHVRYYLYSYNLKTWYLSSARYWHHGSSHTISGSTFAARAAELGTTRPTVASDEDGHGSWAGYQVNKSDCAGSEDSSWNDCFINDWDEDYANGYWEYVQATKNVGGPSPETWNSSVLTVSGSEAYTDLYVGHGTNREYWTYRGDKFKKFCGWECRSTDRKSDGNCNVNAHGEGSCADGPLSGKVDTAYFTLNPPPPPTSCAGYCGSYTGACDCSTSCMSQGNCCNDYQIFCSNDPCPMYFGRSADGTSSQLEPPCEEIIARGELSESAERGRRLVEGASDHWRRQADALDRSQKDEKKRLNALAEDPVAAVVPRLVGVPPEAQLRTLEWMLTFPDQGQWVDLFEDLDDRTGRAPRLAAALEASSRLQDVVALLKAYGYRSADLDRDFEPAGLTEDAKVLTPPEEADPASPSASTRLK